MPVTPRGRGMGYKPSVPDARDYSFTPTIPDLALPPSADLRSQLPGVYDQKALGSCTAFAAGALFRHERRKLHSWKIPKTWGASNRFLPNGTEATGTVGAEDYDISFLAQYYWSRGYSGDQDTDGGAEPRDAFKTMSQRGAAAWHNDVYDILKFDQEPSGTVISNAANHRIKTYHKLTTGSVVEAKQAVAGGHAVFIGVTLYSSFEEIGDWPNLYHAIVPMPDKTMELPVGGHAIVIVGYSDDVGRFVVRNSWGEGWGDKGHCYMPYAMVADKTLVNEMWVIGVGAR